MNDFSSRLSEATAAVFSALGFDPAHSTVKPADRRDLADFQCNGALALAKKVGRKPQWAGKNIVIIIPSFAERYLSTALFEGLDN